MSLNTGPHTHNHRNQWRTMDILSDRADGVHIPNRDRLSIAPIVGNPVPTTAYHPYNG
jgi:hypothetical protein